jgi:hypothetical protein
MHRVELGELEGVEGPSFPAPATERISELFIVNGRRRSITIQQGASQHWVPPSREGRLEATEFENMAKEHTQPFMECRFTVLKEEGYNVNSSPH